MLTLSLLLLLTGLVSSTMIEEPLQYRGIRIQSPGVHIGINNDEAIGNVTVIPNNGCDKDWIGKDYSNQLLLIDISSGKCIASEAARHAEMTNASGVIYARGYSNGFFALYLKADKVVITKPSIEFEAKNYYISEMLKKKETFRVHLKAEYNHYDIVEDPMKFYSVFFGLLSIVCLLIASYRLYQFLRATGWKWNDIGQRTLEAEILYAAVRLASCVDPFYAFGIYTVNEQRFFIGFLIYPPLVSSIMIAIYWQSLLAKFSMLSFMNKFTIPVIVLCIIMIILQIIQYTVFPSNAAFFTALVVSAVIIMFVVAVFYFIVAAGILRSLNIFGAKFNVQKAYQYRKLAIFITLTGMSLVLGMIFIILIATSLYSQPASFCVINFLLSLSLYTGSLTRIFSFKTPGNTPSPSPIELTPNKEKDSNSKDASKDCLLYTSPSPRDA
eukprot:TRINITY_DN3046_c0_g1_i2.p1 TRINITY_DN3046_c0_g1~~TRINITY_DN3046_c0_g1_i2.p1  ORF type:complete len:441 (+),score=82.00 TRINITY_DN3046_c0_g1_i2:135-1457(+)